MSSKLRRNDDFREEKNFISKLLGVKYNKIVIDENHPCGEDVIFINGNYNGYIDQRFYDYMLHGIDDYGFFEEWVEIWRDKK